MHSKNDNEPQPKGPWGFWATLLLGAAILLITFFITVFAATLYIAHLKAPGAMPKPVGDFDGTVITLSTFVSVPIILGCIALCIHFRKGPPIRDYLGLNAVNSETVLRWTGLTLLLLFAAEFLSQIMGRPVLPDFVVETYQTAGNPGLLFIAVVIAAPIAEEIFFRGFLLTGFRSGLGDGAACALSAFLWAVNHFQYDWYEVVLVFLLGIIMGFARIKTGSIYTPLAMHAAVNFLAFVVTAAYLGGG